MKIIEPGHIYQLHHLDGSGSSLLTFVNREKGTEHEGTQTQEVLRAAIDKALHDANDMNEVTEALVDRTKHCDDCLRWEGNDKIVDALNRAAVSYAAAVQNLRMALVLHEARALERKTEKGQLEPEKVATGSDGHYTLKESELAEMNQLTSCDFCGGGCTDPNCLKCYGFEGRGVFLYKSTMGYTVCVDKQVLPMDVSWSEADRTAKKIAKGRRPGDGRGYARCRHPGNDACSKAWHHIEPPKATKPTESTPKCGAPTGTHGRDDCSMDVPCPLHGPFGGSFQARLGEPSTSDYCKTCGESPDSATHIGLGTHPHAYVDPRIP
jgi:hypothetical protein